MEALPRTLTQIALISALIFTGCGSDDAASVPTAMPDRRGSARTTAAERPPACPNPYGGTCLGALDPGTYTTRTFSPAITYTVPGGWTNGEDLPGNFLLQLRHDNRYIGIYRDANAPYKCQEQPDPDVRQSVSAYTRWLRGHPLLHVTKPRPASVGGLHGVVMDISKARRTQGKGCTFDGMITGAVPFIVGGRGPADLHHVILDTPGFEERLYLLRYKRGNIAIEIGPEGESLGEYAQAVTPILHSLRFAKP